MGDQKSQNRWKILVVEDENIVALDIARGLRQLGYDVVAIANNGQDAIEKSAQIHPDLILMDIQLRGHIDGIKAADEIRSSFNIPIIFLTAFADEHTLQRAKVTEPYGYLLKPFDDTELHTAIEVAIQKHKAILSKQARSEQALILSEERFKLFVDSVKDYAIILLDSNGNIISWNSGAERIKGFKSDEVIGQNCSIFYTKEDMLNKKPQIELKIAAKNGTFEEENWQVKKGGTQFWANIMITALRDSKGNLRGYGKVIRDLSIQKRNQEILKESEARKAAVLEAALDCVITIDHHGNILEFNPAAERVFGYKRSNAIGKEMASLIIPPSQRESHRKALLHYLVTENGPVLGKRIEMIALRSNGTKFPVELSIVPLKYGHYPVFTGFIRDITDQKMSLENEKAAKLLLKTQYEVMTILTEATNLKKAAQKILAVIAEKLNWQVGSFWVVDESEEKVKQIETWSASNTYTEFTQESQKWSFEIGQGFPGHIWALHKPIWIRNIGSNLTYPRFSVTNNHKLRTGFGFPILCAKKVLGVIEFFSHDNRYPNHDILQTISTLGQQIGQFMNRLSAEKGLRKAVQLRDEFLSIASHELKTPLTSLGLQLQLAQRKIKPETNTAPPPIELAKTMNRSLKQVFSLSNLVEELLDISRIQAGKLRLNLENLDLAALIRDISDRLAEQLAQVKCSLTFDFADNVFGHWDKHRIEQVFFNLISNIIKYAPGKPAKISIKQHQGIAIISVIDNGPGIVLEKQNKIFDRFERATPATNVSGLGLGLFVVKRIVEAHGGTIQLESTAELGSKFIIHLPVNPTLIENKMEQKKYARSA